ncbi:30S ribosomal protein S8 [candidate division NPL-UPA2 bacterium Unc8]|uniref:Small ribosomal subunit protein uS8 n=1 Tax=candidate division NPL-UPA2 bacterium Unc8 TaxID=1980939 RepID=A0A399FYH8_UNCN2|nr:30S ribosomal protein S8 [Bacillota bacterium]MBT9138165.1 30S ribosomal protein S8 [Bacillota bacterium]MBT9146838.1 30S ribosomal protein S8 [Bacillota bacterium]RII00292.1 MAG: 30S ribosomal protein S8 [candidate division NPL-UPA2 bacterium Unc8]
MTDPVADMLTRVRNASREKRREVDMPSSKLKVEIARIFKEEGFIKEYRVLMAGSKKEILKDDRDVSGKYRVLRIFLRYGSRGEEMIGGIQRVSKPGRRIYVASNEIRRDHRMPILSTSQGIMSGFECRRKGIGGELLCRVW